MSIGGSKNPGRTELVGPYDSVFFSSSFTDRVGKWFAVWPEFINHIKLVFWSYPFLRKTFHYWVIFCKRDNRIFSLVFMPTAGNTEKFSPIINFSGPVSMHCAMYNNGRFPCFMHSGNFLYVFWIHCVCETFIVNDDIIRFCPVWIIIKRYLGFSPRTTLINNSKFNVNFFFDTRG